MSIASSSVVMRWKLMKIKQLNLGHIQPHKCKEPGLVVLFLPGFILPHRPKYFCNINPKVFLFQIKTMLSFLTLSRYTSALQEDFHILKLSIPLPQLSYSILDWVNPHSFNSWLLFSKVCLFCFSPLACLVFVYYFLKFKCSSLNSICQLRPNCTKSRIIT